MTWDMDESRGETSGKFPVVPVRVHIYIIVSSTNYRSAGEGLTVVAEWWPVEAVRARVERAARRQRRRQQTIKYYKAQLTAVDAFLAHCLLRLHAGRWFSVRWKPTGNIKPSYFKIAITLTSHHLNFS
ncbi:hypothetical protein J6590_043807 [Homalodisca vitripennis]|nr:hypothetical protein J6590_043807 [Homalodisca vitripennis]